MDKLKYIVISAVVLLALAFALIGYAKSFSSTSDNGGGNGDSTSIQIVNFEGNIRDSFGRLRISSPVNTMDSSNILGVKNLVNNSEFTSSSGSVTMITNTPSVSISLDGTADADPRAIYQSRQRGIYQPGKSLLVYMTGILNPNNANDANFVGRIGYFDDDDGIFFQHDATGTSIVLRSNLTGTPSDSRSVSQANWNVDKLDGTGPSKIVFDPSKENIFVIDLEWLGAGEVRTGFVIGNTI